MSAVVGARGRVGDARFRSSWHKKSHGSLSFGRLSLWASIRWVFALFCLLFSSNTPLCLRFQRTISLYPHLPHWTHINTKSFFVHEIFIFDRHALDFYLFLLLRVTNNRAAAFLYKYINIFWVHPMICIWAAHWAASGTSPSMHDALTREITPLTIFAPHSCVYFVCCFSCRFVAAPWFQILYKNRRSNCSFFVAQI